MFVNGRLREKNIIRHIPTQRIPESYLYGQLHFDGMDTSGHDPFTSSRESILDDDENFRSLLDYLKSTAIPHILVEWDKLRLACDQDGDGENTTHVSKKERAAKSLYSEAKTDYRPDTKKSDTSNLNGDQVDTWLDELAPDAEFNISAYVDCFLSENLVRKYIISEDVDLSEPSKNEIQQWRERQKKRMDRANISFPIRQNDHDLGFLDMDHMAKCIEGTGAGSGNQVSLVKDAVSYKPVRNVVGHTGLLTDTAKRHLSMTFDNIKARIRKLLARSPACQGLYFMGLP